MSSTKKFRIGVIHHPAWLDFFRIASGKTLVWKGYSFPDQYGSLQQFDQGEHLGTLFSISILAHLIIGLYTLDGKNASNGSGIGSCNPPNRECKRQYL